MSYTTIFFDLDDIGKIVHVVVRKKLLLAAITELATMLAADVRVGAIARPEPVIHALGFVENRLRLVRNKNRAASHDRCPVVARFLLVRQIVALRSIPPFISQPPFFDNVFF